MTWTTTENATIRVFISAMATGLLLRLSFPPHGAGLLIFVAFVPVLMQIWNQRPFYWAWAGSLIAIALYSDSLLAFSSWNFTIILVPFFCSLFVFSAVFFLTALIKSRLAIPLRWLVLPILWMPMSVCCEYFLGLPLSLSIALVMDHPRLLLPVNYIGDAGTDSVILASSSLLVALWKREC